ncbi:MAG: AEC family transporter [Casimicrobiaceae bacterium]
MTIALLLLPDFLLIAFGALLKRIGGFGPGFWPGLERLVYFVLFPALLFRALAHSPLALADALPLAGVGLGYTFAGMALSGLGGRLFELERPVFAACFQCGFRFNTYIALAVASRLGGEASVAAIGLLIGILVPVVNVAAVAMLVHARRALLGQVLRNPLVLACLAGIVWKAAGWPVAEFAEATLALLASAALPLGLLAVGAGLAFRIAQLPVGAIAWWTGLKLVVLPALALGLAVLVGLPPTERTVAVLLAAMPTAPSAYILAMQMNGVGAPVALLISIGTVIAAGTLPLWIAVLQAAGGLTS